MVRKKILVVDDNPVMLKYMDKLLHKEGYEVTTANDGYAALNILVSDVPDILFIDLIMPKIAGDRLCQLIRKMPHLKDIYVVIISAAIAESDIDFAKIGANYCIAKGPFEEMTEEILSAIKASDLAKLGADRSPSFGVKKAYYPRQMTKELLSQKRDLEEVLESIEIGIVEVFSGKIIYANTAAISLFGCSQEELLATDFIDLIELKDQLKLKKIFIGERGESTGIDPQNSFTINQRQVVIKIFSKKRSASTSIILLIDLTLHNLMEFQIRQAQKVNAIVALSQRANRSFGKPLANIQRFIKNLFQESNVPDSIKKVDNDVQKLIDLNHQFFVLSNSKESEIIKDRGYIERGNETILLTDSEVIIREVNRLILKELGYNVIIAERGKEAIDKYKVRSGKKKYNKIDLVIVDIALPDMTAEEVCKSLKQLSSKLKILICGKLTPDDNPIISQIREVNGYIQKPFKINQLSIKIRDILDAK